MLDSQRREDMAGSGAVVFIASVVIALVSLLGLVGGAVMVMILAPQWAAAWLASALGPTPRVYWYLSRAAGLVAYLLVWLSVVLGLLMTNRLARVWPGGPTINDLHQFTSLLSLALAAVHVLVLLGDRYIGYSLAQLLVPFASGEYRPLWVGLGQVALYLTLPVTFSFYVRRFIGYRAWRLIHYGSFGVYVLVTLHSLTAGTDTLQPAALALYGLTGLTIAALTVYRIGQATLRPRLS